MIYVYEDINVVEDYICVPVAYVFYIHSLRKVYTDNIYFQQFLIINKK